LAVARKIQDEGSHAIALANIAPCLHDEQKSNVLDEALAVARKIQNEWSHAIALANIAPCLQDEQKSNVLDEALAVAREIQNELSRVRCFGRNCTTSSGSSRSAGCSSRNRG